MINNKSIIAIIPARAGSKRLKGKNILPLAGKPLIVWTIEAALKSKYIDLACVSTDDDSIAAIARDYGADVPFLRPVELSSDDASSISVVLHTIEYYKKKYKEYEYIMLLQPTSPLRSSQHIDESIELLLEKKADAIISVCEMEHSPLWSNTLPLDLAMNDFLSAEVRNKRSQDLPRYYRLNGAIYLCKTQRLIQENTFLMNDSIYAYIMSQDASIDIDTTLDFKIAEALLA